MEDITMYKCECPLVVRNGYNGYAPVTSQTSGYHLPKQRPKSTPLRTRQIQIEAQRKPIPREFSKTRHCSPRPNTTAHLPLLSSQPVQSHFTSSKPSQCRPRAYSIGTLEGHENIITSSNGVYHTNLTSDPKSILDSIAHKEGIEFSLSLGGQTTTPVIIPLPKDIFGNTIQTTNPHLVTAQVATETFAKRFGLYEDATDAFKAMYFSALISGAYQTKTFKDPEVLSIVVDLVSVLLSHDDAIDQSDLGKSVAALQLVNDRLIASLQTCIPTEFNAINRHCLSPPSFDQLQAKIDLNILEKAYDESKGKVTTFKPIADEGNRLKKENAIRDIASRLKPIGLDLNKFVGATVAYLRATQEEVASREEKRLMHLSAYTILRQKTGAADAFVQLGLAFLKHPTISKTALYETANILAQNLIGRHNDMFSYPKEYRKTPENAVIIKQRELQTEEEDPLTILNKSLTFINDDASNDMDGFCETIKKLKQDNIRGYQDHEAKFLTHLATQGPKLTQTYHRLKAHLLHSLKRLDPSAKLRSEDYKALLIKFNILIDQRRVTPTQLTFVKDATNTLERHANDLSKGEEAIALLVNWVYSNIRYSLFEGARYNTSEKVNIPFLTYLLAQS